MCFSCGRIRPKSKSCHYKIRPTEKFDESVDARKVTTEQKQFEPNEEAFGPWVFVSRKRQPSKSFKKGKAHLPQEESSAQKPKSFSPNKPFNFFSIGLVNSDLGKGEGKSKFRDFFTDNAFVADLTTANISVEKLYVRHRLQMTKHLS